MTDEPLPGRIVGNSILLKDLEISEVHDHLCLLYDSTLDWRTFVASYIKTGLECGERCCYIYDTHTARQIRDLLRADNVDVTALEASGQLNIIHGHKTYFKNGYFDPDFLISSYVVETEKAISQGCPGLRITFETDWALHYQVPAAQLLEYESRLNGKLFPRYPFLNICQYERAKFEPEVIKGLLLTHPRIIRGNRVYSNPYYVLPDKYANYNKAGMEARYWLENIERETKKETDAETGILFGKVFEESPLGIALSNPQFRFVKVNAAMCHMLGYSESELLNLSFKEITHPDNLQTDSENIRKLQAGEIKEYQTQKKYLRKDGKAVWGKLTATLVHDETGQFLYFMAVIENINELKIAELGLRESERKFRELAELTPGAIFEADSTGKLTYVNRLCFEYFGFSVNTDISIFNVFDFIAPEDHQKAANRIQRVMRGENPEFEEYTGINKEETRFPVLINSSVIKNARGDPSGIRGVIIDITGRKKTEEQLLLSEARLESLLRISQYKAGNIQNLLDFALREAIQLTKSKIGYIYHYSEKKQEFTLNTWSRGVMEACSVRDARSIYQLENTGIWGEAVRQRKAIILNDFQSPHPLKKGMPQGHAELTRFMTIPVIVSDKVVAVVGVANKDTDYESSDERQLTLLMDSTWKIVDLQKAEESRRHAAEKLEILYKKEKEQREELEKEAKARSMFIDVLAHELRTPLTPIMVSTGMLKEILGPSTNEITQKLAQNIQSASEILATRLEELLDLGRYSRGTFKLELQPVDFLKYLNGIIDRLRPLIAQKKQEFIVDIPEKSSEVNLDPSRFEQVIINLISNAAKFSPENGKIFLNIKVTDKSLNMEVKDEGIGITPEEQERLFQPYHRVEQDRQKFPGIGLGLAVSKQLVEAHGGKIWVESLPGQGSVFSLAIPLGNTSFKD